PGSVKRPSSTKRCPSTMVRLAKNCPSFSSTLSIMLKGARCGISCSICVVIFIPKGIIVKPLLGVIFYFFLQQFYKIFRHSLGGLWAAPSVIRGRVSVIPVVVFVFARSKYRTNRGIHAGA